MKNHFSHFLLSLFLFLCLLFTASEKEQECSEKYIARVQSAEGPTTAALNQLIALNVSFGTSNGCQRFNRFYTISAEKEVAIQLEVLEEGCAYTQEALLRSEAFTFGSQEAGEYLLKFQKGTSFVEHTITAD
ncbi:MAG: hypothetical protein ACJAU0_002682 [Flavobacteriales bacterium]|jgi:hypothetical protein